MTAVIAVLVAFDLHGIALSLFFLVVVPIALIRFSILLLFRLQLFTATCTTSYFYSRKLIRVVHWICGADYAAWALNSYAVRLALNDQDQAAIDAFTRVLSLDDTIADYWTNRGASKYRIGQFEDAVSDLTTALDIAEGHQLAHTYRGFAQLSLENLPAALDDLAVVNCTIAEHYLVANYRGHLHELLHDWQSAIDDFLLAYELDSTQPGAGIALARLQAGCPEKSIRNGAKAVENAINMCLRTKWSDWVAISVLAAAYSEVGNFDQALKYGNLALDLAPEHEKLERTRRIKQFEEQVPFRIPLTSASTGLPITNVAI